MKNTPSDPKAKSTAPKPEPMPKESTAPEGKPHPSETSMITLIALKNRLYKGTLYRTGDELPALSASEARRLIATTEGCYRIK